VAALNKIDKSFGVAEPSCAIDVKGHAIAAVAMPGQFRFSLKSSSMQGMAMTLFSLTRKSNCPRSFTAVPVTTISVEARDWTSYSARMTTICWLVIEDETRSTADRGRTGWSSENPWGEFKSDRRPQGMCFGSCLRPKRCGRCNNEHRSLRRHQSKPELSPIIVGSADLHNEIIVDLLQTSYQAGNAIVLGSASADDAELLLPVGVQASQGVSNDNVTIEILGFLSSPPGIGNRPARH
jgi:hypothetical protein